MKKIMFCAMVFIGSICTRSAIAQTFDGHGMSYVNVQRETSPAVIESNFNKMVFGTSEEAASFIRDDLHNVRCQQIQDALYHEIARQMQDDFTPGLPNEYRIDYDIIQTNTPQWRTFCNENEDGYMLDQVGEVNFIYGNPAKSWVSENKSFRIVATITKLSNGRKARLFADCFNPIHSKEYGTRNPPPQHQNTGSYFAPAPIIQTVSVVVNKPSPYQDMDQRNAIRNSSGCPKWVVPAVIVAAAATIVTIICLHKSHSNGHDNTYNNDFQGGSGSSGASGGTGGQQSW